MDLPTELIEAFQLDSEEMDLPGSDMASHPASEAASHPASDMSSDTPSTDPIYLECHVQGLTAKVFLNRPLDELIPAKYLERAEETRKSSSPSPTHCFGVGIPRPLSH